MLIEKFEDIEAWKEARKLTSAVYKLTHENQFKNDFALCNQIQRASISCMANIAEGFGRVSKQEFIRFLDIAYSSTIEVQSHLYAALDLNYIKQDQFDFIYSQAKKTAKLIAGFIRYLRNKK